MLPSEAVTGAGEGNRTLVVSLEGFCSTIELHPPDTFEHSLPHQSENPHTVAATSIQAHPKKTWWRGKDSNLRRLSQQIYSLPPLTAREPLRTKPIIMARFCISVNELGTKNAGEHRAGSAQHRQNANPGKPDRIAAIRQRKLAADETSDPDWWNLYRQKGADMRTTTALKLRSALNVSAY
jgi:hypothetical protein